MAEVLVMFSRTPVRPVYTAQERVDAIEAVMVEHFVTVTRIQRELYRAVVDGRRAADAMARLERRLNQYGSLGQTSRRGPI